MATAKINLDYAFDTPVPEPKNDKAMSSTDLLAFSVGDLVNHEFADK